MWEPGDAVAMAAQLEDARDQLSAISRRVEEASQATPTRDASGWAGLAADAYQRSLDQLNRELGAAQELIRSASDLTSAAMWEVGGRA